MNIERQATALLEAVRAEFETHGVEFRIDGFEGKATMPSGVCLVLAVAFGGYADVTISTPLDESVSPAEKKAYGLLNRKLQSIRLERGGVNPSTSFRDIRDLYGGQAGFATRLWNMLECSDRYWRVAVTYTFELSIHIHVLEQHQQKVDDCVTRCFDRFTASIEEAKST